MSTKVLEQAEWQEHLVSPELAWSRYAYQHDLLTPEQEIALGKRIAAGDESAVHELVESNFRLAYSIALKYYRKMGGQMSLADLLQEANIGLMIAAKKFDYRKGCRFSTYATRWISQAVIRAISQQSHVIRVPLGMSELVNKGRKAAERFQQERGRLPTIEELSTELDIDIAKAESILAVMSQRQRTDTFEDEDGTLENVIESLPDEETAEPDTFAEQIGLQTTVQQALGTLTSREAYVLRMHYGLDGLPEHSLEEISKRLGVTRQRVQQIERRALEKLREGELAEVLKN